MMKRAIYHIMTVLLCFFISCDVHEWPEVEKDVKATFLVELDFDTAMSEKEYFYNARSVSDIEGYEMRYTLRAFPIESSESGRATSRAASWEHVFTRKVSTNDYDTTVEVEMELPGGDYSLMVWADFVKAGTVTNHFYAPDNFAEITLHGEHKANTDMRDAFRGTTNITMNGSMGREGSVLVQLSRPLAKFSFVSSDLQEFIDKELEARNRNAACGEESRSLDLSDYKVMFYYNGFMPCAYNMFTSKPNDSKVGVRFESAITVTSESEALMGFDYVFVNGSEATASIILALYDKDGKEIFSSNPIPVPIKRAQHTIMRGEFLTIDTSGGVGIVPDFDGEYNYEIKY